MRTKSGGQGDSRIAVIVGAELAEENVPPVATVKRRDGEFERGQFRTLRLTEPTLKADVATVGR